ncbi:MAG: hypothetical protein AB7N71_03870 [Phycisphaerae bacterium]
MNRFRRSAFVFLLLIALGVLGGLGGYAAYLRSSMYRSYCAQRLSNKIGLESAIGRVIPRTWYSRDFADILAWLPNRRALAAAVSHARLQYDRSTPSSDDYFIQLAGGRCEVSTRTWFREDYRFVVESGLRPGFDPDGPTKIVFSDFDIAFQRGDFNALLEDANGLIRFEDQTIGKTSISCRKFNGHPLAEPVVLTSEFSPTRDGIQIDHLDLRVPDVPLNVVGLQSLAGIAVSQGTFSGTLSYLESDDGECVTLEGECRDLVLAELTKPFVTPPWHGTCPRIRLDELTVNHRIPERLRFSGRIAGIHVRDLLALARTNSVAGELVLDVREANLSPRGIEKLIASGKCEAVDLAALSEFTTMGSLTGTALLEIRDLTIVQNRLENLELRLRAQPNRDEPGYIGRDLIAEAARRILKINLPPLLPEQIEYLDFGVELRVSDEVMYIHGTHGELDQTILTVKGPGGLTVPLIREPKSPIQLTEWLDPLRERMLQLLQTEIQRLENPKRPAAPAME